MDHRDNNDKNRILRGKNALSLLLTGTILFMSTACKPSPALREYVYDNLADQIHQSMERELENEIDNTDPDPSISPEKFDQTGSDRDRERNQAMLGDHANAEGRAPSPTRTPNAHDPQQGSGIKRGNSGAAGGSSGVSGNSGSQSENGNASGNGGGNGNGESWKPSGGENDKDVVDDNGNTQETPLPADSLAAVGNAAMIIEMLGGNDKLRLTSASIKEGLSAGMLVTDQAEALWQGNGSSSLGDVEFEKLLKKKPGACLEISGQATFTEEQIRRLEEAGIRYVVIPAVTDYRSACQAVEVTAELIGTDEARERSRKYQDFCSRVESLVSGKTDPYSPDGIDYTDGSTNVSYAETDGQISLYISGWDQSAHYQLYNENIEMEGNGAAVVQTGYLNHPLTAFLSKAGVANAAALAENNYSLQTFRLRYVNPIVNSLYNLSITGGQTGATYSKDYVYTSATSGNLGAAVNNTGNTRFQSIIVPNAAIREAVSADGLWKAYDYQTSSGGHIQGYGFLDSKNRLVETTIHGNYSIYVMPQGAADWNTGSAESILIPVWALWKIRGLIGQDELVGMIREFYQVFYNYSLSDAEIGQILVE